MPTLVQVYEKFQNHQLQVIELVAEANTREAAAELGYNDFKANLYIKGKFIADISPVIATSEAWEKMIDETDWVEKFREATEKIEA
ncbi:hypothetical protein ACFS6H_19840 [Terrimonas rubra]|uniref:Uncharacterized protein n=1 Tax=Terrimonas rubra TaxID=1035890 RepID=A0ABW6A9L4_9BACT